MTTGASFVHAVPPIFDHEKPSPEEEAAVMRLLERHEALDVAVMLGLGET